MSYINGLHFVSVSDLVWHSVRPLEGEDNGYAYTMGEIRLPSGMRKFRITVTKIDFNSNFTIKVEVFNESEFECTFHANPTATGFMVGMRAGVRYVNGLMVDRHTGGSYGEGRKCLSTNSTF